VRVVVLMNTGSRFGLEILNELQRHEVPVKGLVLIDQPLRYQWMLFQFVRRRVGWLQAVIFGVIRVVHDWLGTRSLRRRDDLVTDLDALAERVVHGQGTNTPSTLAALRELAPDVIVIGQTGILRKKLLSIPRLGTLNGHPGVLPNYRGIDSFQWAVLNGEPENVGATVHWVDSGVDTGPILRVERFAVRDEPILAYEDWLFRQSARMLAETVAAMDANDPPRGEPQGEGRQFYKMSLGGERRVRTLLRRLGRERSNA
jgi:folate-dependent phosphoribosylglycinamide formyltransferase PurN